MTSLNLIRCATHQQLRDRAWLEQAIADLGLGERKSEHPESLWAHFGGLEIFQYPIQLAPYLIDLSERMIDCYAEIGIYKAGTFALVAEYLARFHPLRLALGIDIELRPEARAYASANPAVRLVQARSESPAARRALLEARPDLVFIDGDHAEAACRGDWELACASGARLVGFHDIYEWSCLGVARVWRGIGLPKKEYIDQYPGINAITYGIGLVEMDGHADF